MVYKILMTGMSPVLAGTETFIMNYYRQLDSSKFQVDFIKRTREPIVFEDEIISKGSRVYYLPRKGKNPLKYMRELREFFATEGKKYDAIWYNAMAIPNLDLLKYAKKYGIKTRIIHSHSSMFKGNKVRQILHNLNRSKLPQIATHFFACSGIAADYMFIDKIRSGAQIIQNAIEVDNFSFSEKDRLDLRTELGWNDCRVIGNVGRLDIQKNQPFLIDVFYEAYKKNPNLRLVIIGKVAGANSTVDLIKEKIKSYGIEDEVLLAGSQKDMKRWLSSLDLFVLPSIFEGLPLSAVEAQANGLPVLVSDAVTTELKILDSIRYLSLDASITVWAKAILELLEKPRATESEIEKMFKLKGFEIETQTLTLQNILLGEMNEKVSDC